MVVLWFSSKDEEDEESSAAMLAKLKDAKADETTEWLTFSDYHFDEDVIVRAVIDLFHRAFQKGLQLKRLGIYQCTDRIDEILQVACSLDIFDKISLVGHGSELSLHGFWSISAAMKFNRHLTKLNLSDMQVTRQQVAALGAGLITSNSQHFKELCMCRVTFFDGAITELASGLKENSSLCTLCVDDGNLEDAELAELVDAVKSHPSLKQLQLWKNAGQEHALTALGKLLASRCCNLEYLDFSYQAENQGGLTGRLGTLVQGLLQGNSSLTSLHLPLNGLLDEDVDDLGQILATCKLEKLDLRNNGITRSGFVRLTQNIPKSLKSFNFRRNDFSEAEAACHILALFKEHPQLWTDGFYWDDSESPMGPEIQHFKDLNQCGRILLAPCGAIPLSVWPVVLARANTWLGDFLNSEERIPNAIFHLLQGPALMQRRFDRDYSGQATCVGASERTTTCSKRPAVNTIDKEIAKEGRLD
jgi:hypothetical protein